MMMFSWSCYPFQLVLLSTSADVVVGGNTVATTIATPSASPIYNSRAITVDTDIFAYWKAKQFDYPVIACIVRDYLAIPATSAPSESVFSQASDIVTKRGTGCPGNLLE
jgi:hypothetical protein